MFLWGCEIWGGYIFGKTSIKIEQIKNNFKINNLKS